MITVFCFSRRAVTVMAQSNCNFLESTSDKCRSADFIIVQDQRVDKQKEGQPEAETSKRIRLAQIYKQKWGGFVDQQKSVRRGANQQTSKPATGVLPKRWNHPIERLRMHWPLRTYESGREMCCARNHRILSNSTGPTLALACLSWRSQLRTWIPRPLPYQLMGKQERK